MFLWITRLERDPLSSLRKLGDGEVGTEGIDAWLSAEAARGGQGRGSQRGVSAANIRRNGSCLMPSIVRGIFVVLGRSSDPCGIVACGPAGDFLLIG